MKSKSALLCFISLFFALLPVFSASEATTAFDTLIHTSDILGVLPNQETIHFTTRKDTVVFHPSAFQLDTDSKLNELLRQIPGIFLKGDQLYWLGKQLSLKIDEEGYFGGNGIISLIPCYVIKEVAIFNSLSDLSKASRNNDQTDDYTLSINLWPKYKGRWHVDMTSGAQTPEQYEVGSDILHIDTGQSFIAFFNANNLNKSTTPTQILNASSEIGQYGRQQFGALSFHHNWESCQESSPLSHHYFLNATAGHTDGWGDTFLYKETYLLDGNTNYSIQKNDHYMHLLHPTFSGEIKCELDDVSSLKLVGEVSYSKTESWSDLETAQLSDAPFSYSSHPLKDIFGDNACNIFNNQLINRETGNKVHRGHMADCSAKATWERLISKKSYIEINASVQYTDTRREYDSHYHIDYIHLKRKADEQRYNDNPTHRWMGLVDAQYQYWITHRLLLTANYSFSKIKFQEKQNHYFYAGKDLEHEEILEHPDKNNSFRHRYEDNRHALKASLVYQLRNVSIMPSLTWIYEKEKAHHVRPHIDTLVQREKPIWKPTMKVKWQISPLMEGYTEYGYSTFRPNLLNVIPWVDNTNPLLHLKSNPNLHACNFNAGEIYFRGSFPNHQAFLCAWFKFRHVNSPITRAITYNKVTDVYTARPQNALRPTYSFEWNIDYQHFLSDKYSIRSRLNYFIKNQDGFLTGFSEHESLTSNRQHISEATIAPELIYENQPDFRCAIYGELIFTRNRYESFIKHYQPLQQYDYGIKIENNFGDFQVRTNFHDLIYKGYVNKKINGHHLLWSASAAWFFLKGKGKLKLSCDDILNNTLLYHRKIEPNTHTEIYENKQHHFINLTFTYHFAPK